LGPAGIVEWACSRPKSGEPIGFPLPAPKLLLITLGPYGILALFETECAASDKGHGQYRPAGRVC
jgi:hypothetical protein